MLVPGTGLISDAKYAYAQLQPPNLSITAAGELPTGQTLLRRTNVAAGESNPLGAAAAYPGARPHARTIGGTQKHQCSSSRSACAAAITSGDTPSFTRCPWICTHA